MELKLSTKRNFNEMSEFKQLEEKDHALQL